MKRQEQVTGIRKWFGDDWLDLQNEIINVLETGFLKDKGNVILSRCKRTGVAPNYFYDAGICLIGGKLCTFEGFSTSAATIYLKLDTTQVVNRNYLDGISKKIATVYRAVAQTTTPSGQYITIDGSNKHRLQLPYVDSTGALKDIPKTDTLLNDANVLVSGAALEQLRNMMQNQFNTLDTIVIPSLVSETELGTSAQLATIFNTVIPAIT